MSAAPALLDHLRANPILPSRAEVQALAQGDTTNVVAEAGQIVAAQQVDEAFTASAEHLARICALHHQRQLSQQLSCQFEGCQIWITPGQAHAPQGKARIDIVQHGDERLELLWRGQPLQYRAHTVHAHLRGKRALDDKAINERMDTLVREQRRIARLKAEIALHEDMRRHGVYRPDTHVSAPPGLGRYGLRPAQPSPGNP